MNPILDFQQDCYKNYLKDVKKLVPEIPDPYLFPDGNPILPVMPIETYQNGIMVIGAFPSARFEKRDGHLIPIGNNLSPFGTEKYFDGQKVREQASRAALDKDYFAPLNIQPNQIWLTDLVKVYLYPEKHIVNCKSLSLANGFVNTHKLFEKMAYASLEWMKREIELCNPALIITLGEIPARFIGNDLKTGTKELLNGNVRHITIKNKEYDISHLAHPEIRRLNKEWDALTSSAIENLAIKIRAYTN